VEVTLKAGGGTGWPQGRGKRGRDEFRAAIDLLDDEIGRRDCHRHGETDVCVYHFPILDTHSPGMWRVVIRKTSPEPATVRFRIAFEAVR
jgi:hypothetical protein